MIDQLDKIDFISTHPNRDVVLTISDHLDWDGADEHLLLLQNKINSYLQFIEGGQINEEYPNAKDRQIVISLAAKYQPPAQALIFLNHCKEKFAGIGVKFEWTTLYNKT